MFNKCLCCSTLDRGVIVLFLHSIPRRNEVYQRNPRNVSRWMIFVICLVSERHVCCSHGNASNTMHNFFMCTRPVFYTSRKNALRVCHDVWKTKELISIKHMEHRGGRGWSSYIAFWVKQSVFPIRFYSLCFSSTPTCSHRKLH